jgi:hypothetical protein
MVRLVFRPYTQVRRSICTSESLRTSTRVSSGFVLLEHSSPSFGSERVGSNFATCTRQCDESPMRHRPRPTDLGEFRFHCAFWFRENQMTRLHVQLLGPCFKTGRIGDQQAADQRYTSLSLTHPACSPAKQHRTALQFGTASPSPTWQQAPSLRCVHRSIAPQSPEVGPMHKCSPTLAAPTRSTRGYLLTHLAPLRQLVAAAARRPKVRYNDPQRPAPRHTER